MWKSALSIKHYFRWKYLLFIIFCYLIIAHLQLFNFFQFSEINNIPTSQFEFFNYVTTRIDDFNLIRYLNIIILLTITLYPLIINPLHQKSFKHYLLLRMETRLNWYLLQLINTIFILVFHYLILIIIYLVVSFIRLKNDTGFTLLLKLLLPHSFSFIISVLLIFLVILSFQLLTNKFNQAYILTVFSIIIYDIASFHFINTGLGPVVTIIGIEQKSFILEFKTIFFQIISLIIVILINYIILRKSELK